MWNRLFLLVLLAAGAPATLPAAETLRWKFSPNDDWKLQLTQSTKTQGSLRGREITIGLEVTIDMQWKVEAVLDPDQAKIRQTIQRIRLTSSTGDTAVSYDSDDQQPSAAAQSIAESVSPLLASPVTVTMTDRGEIVDVQVGDQLSQQLEKIADARWKEMFSPAGMKQLLGRTTCVFPEAAVAEGDRWTSQIQVPSRWGGLKVDHHYTYQGLKMLDGQNVSQIDVDSTLQLPPQKDDSQVEIKNQQQQGTIYFDNQSGCLKKSQVHQQLETESKYREFQTTVRVTSDATLRLDR